MDMTLPSRPSRPLKVGVVSPVAANAQRLEALLKGRDPSSALLVERGGADQAARLVERERPDVVLLEAQHSNATELAILERIAARAPGTALILMSPNQDAEFLRQGMRAGLREILPMPVVREMLFEALDRVQHRLTLSAAVARSGKLYTFVGCKGGCGTTFLATNLASAMSMVKGTRVAVIDLDRRSSDAALYLTDRRPTATLDDVMREVHRLDETLLSASMLQVTPTLSVLAAGGDADAPPLDRQSLETLLWTACRAYDVVVVDAGLGLERATLQAMEMSDAVFAVTQLGLPFLRGTRRLLDMLTALGCDPAKVEVLLNRNGRLASLPIEDFSRALRRVPMRTLPNSFAAVSAALNQGEPIMQLAPRDPVARSLRDLAESLLMTEPAARGGFFAGLLAAR